MNLREKYRAWKEDWPEASKWAVPMWIGAVVIVVCGAGQIYHQSKQADTSWQAPTAPAQAPKAKPAWREQAAAAALQFPADPELWQEAGALLMDVEPERANDLLRLAAALQSTSRVAGLKQAKRAGPPTSDQSPAEGWQIRAFKLENTPANRTLVRAVVERTEPSDDSAEAQLAQACSDTPDRAVAFLGWLMLQSRWRDSLAWINRLRPELATAPQVRQLKIELLCRMGSFNGLRDSILAEDKSPGLSDPTDLALCGCMAREQGHEELGHQLWGAAIGACGQNSAALATLLRLGFYVGIDRQLADEFEPALASLPSDSEAAQQWMTWRRLRGAAQAPLRSRPS